ncbi:DNA-processing protein DprA [Alkalicoccus urumqiensis]|uniref:DNA-protecting protein DprA n=1 Tax=Alkalicoccus urumqiensis TaxID=1548213 RepID=A0A2P6MG51_ALKUR|nr:DNA-processing protein DprA [Alkalicoccus urumqiensis]PRO65241.1 DNA-protecting protein DprA [Alkalicoccus urumqiensis]
MNKFKQHLLILHCALEGNSRIVQKYRRIDPGLEQLFTLEGSRILTALTRSQRAAAAVADLKINSPFLQWSREGIECLTIDESSYPGELFCMSVPPQVLFLKGNTNLLNVSPKLAVVGARHPSERAARDLHMLTAPSIQAGVLIISGMAQGVDTSAHETAFQENGSTIAVLGFGINHLYPRSAYLLKKRLEKEQLVVSEYPPDIRPKPYQFPERNRIISGLAQVVLVVEAKERSGSLITAETALEQGKEVLAVPGRITDPLSAGTNRLIQDGAGAALKPEDILEEFFR